MRFVSPELIKNKLSRRVAVIAAVFVMLTLLPICAYALTLSSTSITMPEATAYKPYSEAILPADESEGCTFENLSALPAGLSLDSATGVISGTPTAAGTLKNLRIRVTKDGDSATVKISMKIARRQLDAVVASDNSRGSTASFDYDGQEHAVTVTFTDHNTGDNVEVTSYSVYYGDTLCSNGSGVVDAGEYPITLVAPSGTTIISKSGVDNIVIYSIHAEITMADKTVKYGEEYTMDVTTVPAGIVAYRLEYKKRGDDEYTETKPTNVGVYDVRAVIDGDNYDKNTAEATLTIRSSQTVNFTVTDNNYVYNAQEHTATVTGYLEDGNVFSTDNYTVSYTDSSGGTVTPMNVGTYKIVITVNNPNAYEIGTVTPSTLVITGETINFTATNTEVYYNGAAQAPVITAAYSSGDACPEDKYKVTYTKDGAEVTEMTVPGDYEYNITVYDAGYSPAGDYYGTFTIKKAVIDFTVQNCNYQYDGNAHTADISAEWNGAAFTDFTTDYQLNGVSVASPTEKGEYDIVITLNDDTLFEIGTVSQSTLSITDKKVNFTVTNTTAYYDGSAHYVSVSALDEDGAEFPAESYTVAYTNASGAAVTAPTEIGVYNVIISINSDIKGYEKGNVSAETLTISGPENAIGTLNMGNSPAAMIYADSSKSDEWREAALAALTADKHFSENYLPTGCKAGIYYLGLGGADLDVNTVIATDILNVTDPKMTVLTRSGETVEVSGVLSDTTDEYGMYTLDYEYVNPDDGTDTVNMSRKVIIVKSIIGDINGNGFINVIDANFLQKYIIEKETATAESENRDPRGISETDLDAETVDELRVYDVNNDGKLNIDDIYAVIGHYSISETSYYPWVY